MSQFKPNQIKCRFIGKLLSGGFSGPEDKDQRSHHGKGEREKWKEKSRKRTLRERERRRGRRERKRGPKCVDYLGTNSWGRAAQPLGWKVQGWGQDMQGWD